MKEELIDMSWDNPKAQIVQHILKITSEYTPVTRCLMNKITVSEKIWYLILTNDQVRIVSCGGTYANWTSTKEKTPEETRVIEGLPFLSFAVKADIPDDTVLFGTDLPLEDQTPEDTWAVKVVF